MKTGVFKKFFGFVKSIFIDSHKNLNSIKSVVIVAGRCIATVIGDIAFLSSKKHNREFNEFYAFLISIAGMFWAFH